MAKQKAAAVPISEETVSMVNRVGEMMSQELTPKQQQQAKAATVAYLALMAKITKPAKQ